MTKEYYKKIVANFYNAEIEQNGFNPDIKLFRRLKMDALIRASRDKDITDNDFNELQDYFDNRDIDICEQCNDIKEFRSDLIKEIFRR